MRVQLHDAMMCLPLQSLGMSCGWIQVAEKSEL